MNTITTPSRSSRYYEEDLRRREELKKLSQELRREKAKNKKMEFSKKLLVQESILIWLVTLSFIVLAFYCVIKQYFGELPWLTALAGFPWTAYGVSQAFYYNKSKSENTKDGIKFETTMAELIQQEENTDALG